MNKRCRETAVRGGLTLLALTALAVLAGIVFYLFKEGLPVFKFIGPLRFIFGTDWYPVGDAPDFEIGSLIAGSLAVTVLASVIAVPLGIATAAYLSEVASVNVRRVVKPFIELLAALPSVVIGFIGMVLVAPWLQKTLGIATGLNLFNAALMLAFMAVPTICSVSEDALHAVPRALKDASLALGATPWETLKLVTVPYALSGIGTAVILGMSRALGETMVVLMVAGARRSCRNPCLIPFGRCLRALRRKWRKRLSEVLTITRFLRPVWRFLFSPFFLMPSRFGSRSAIRRRRCRTTP